MDGFNDEVLKHEAEFADGQYLEYADDLDISEKMFTKYSNPANMWDWRQRSAVLMGDLTGKSFLDYGCGMGEEAIYAAKLGAIVTAIDISQVGIDITRKRAEHNGLVDRVTAQVMKGNPTEFSAESFDVVHGLGILHHIGLDESLTEIKRILKPGGIGIFLEPMGSSAAVERMKNWMIVKLADKKDTREVTDLEEAIRFKDLMKFSEKFSYFRVYPYHLLTRARVLIPRQLHNLVWKTDHYTLKILPFMRHYAGAAVIHFIK